MLNWLKEAWGIAASIPSLVSLISKIVDWAEKTINEYRLRELSDAIHKAEQRATQELDQRDLQNIGKK